jgi:hypothetical protein
MLTQRRVSYRSAAVHDDLVNVFAHARSRDAALLRGWHDAP